MGLWTARMNTAAVLNRKRFSSAMSRYLYTQTSPAPSAFRCLWHFVNWPLVRCSGGGGKPWNSCRPPAKPRADTCDAGWSHCLLRSFVSIIHVSVMWSIPSQPQTLASFVFCEDVFASLTGTKKKKKSSHMNPFLTRLLPVGCVAFTNHTLIRYSKQIPAQTDTHLQRGTHWIPRSHTHTLTTYCLASKAYVGRPRVLFISSLW